MCGLCIALCMLNSFIQAQQTPLYSLSSYNQYVINPAYAGVNSYYSAHVNSRYQFVGIENAPVTTSFSFYGPHKSLPMGWGGMILNDGQGAFSRFAAYGSYSYSIDLSTVYALSFGLHAGFMQYTVDLTKVRFLHSEVNVSEDMFQSVKPDATFGMYLQSSRLYAGFSLDQLFRNEIDVIDDTLVMNNETIYHLLNHVTINGGYMYSLSSDVELKPTMRIRYFYRTPLQVELGAMATYKNILSTGIQYRSGGAFVMHFAYNYRNKIHFGYAYDLNYNALRKDSFGSHEIYLGLQFNSIK
ncbi:MAG: type IX secretion system membrane protein PorP/SprF [Bacteroidales bacterium]|nr:type IX secretion system membrane protein PorP/SprF [Bacteroidales bacterium]